MHISARLDETGDSVIVTIDGQPHALSIEDAKSLAESLAAHTHNAESLRAGRINQVRRTELG